MAFLKSNIIIIGVVAAFSWTASGHTTEGKTESVFDAIWGPTTKQEFEGLSFSENSDKSPATQITPAILQIGQRFGSPYLQALERKKPKPGKDDYSDLGASLMSGGTLFSLGALMLVTMAGKAMLLAFGAIALTFLAAGWTGGGAGGHKSGSASTVYEVIARPQITHGHSYSSEVHHEPYYAPPQRSGYNNAPPAPPSSSITPYDDGYVRSRR